MKIAAIVIATALLTAITVVAVQGSAQAAGEGLDQYDCKGFGVEPMFFNKKGEWYKAGGKLNVYSPLPAGWTPVGGGASTSVVVVACKKLN